MRQIRFGHTSQAQPIYIELPGASVERERPDIVRTEEMGSGVLLDYDANGNILGIEIIVPCTVCVDNDPEPRQEAK